MEGPYYAKAAAMLGAALVMGIGSIGPAFGQGLIGSRGIENIGKFPENAGQVRNAMILAMAIVETSGVFALLVALMLIFTNR